MLFIKKTKDFHDIFNNKKRLNGNLFSVYYKVYANGKDLKVGIITGKKVGNAVKRNKFKRRVRAYFRQRKEIFDYPLGLIIIAKAGLEDYTFSQLKEELDKTIEKIISYENI